LQEEAKQEIEASVEFAKNSKEPSIDTLLEDVYA
jgi:TPP-dependent pyruvate/acetoin dehydrogenase alpha subunit